MDAKTFQLQPLVERIATACAELAAALKEGRSLPALNLRRSARLPVLAALHARLNAPILLITDRADHALTLFDELALWAPAARRMLFLEPTPLFYENAPWGDTTRYERLKVLTTLAAYHIPGAQGPETEQTPILIAPARALMARTMPRRDFLRATRSLRVGQVAQPEELARTWVTIGYESVTTVVTPGQFARRGGIVDLWSPAQSQPVRIEFFDDEIETLRLFDPASQRTTGTLDRILVTPAREYILPAAQDDLPAEVSEFHLPLFHATPASLLDYLPRQALVMADDLQLLQDAITDVEEQAVRQRQELVKDGVLADDFPVPYLSWVELADTLPRHTLLELGGMASADWEAKPDPGFIHPLSERFVSETRFGGRLKPFIDHLVTVVNQGDEVTIVSRQSPRLIELWAEQAALLTPGAPAPAFMEGSLTEGWTYNGRDTARLHLYTDGEIFGWRRPEPRQRPRSVAESPESVYSDLQAGDYVVHVDHGIGVFIGLVTRTIDGLEREYLCVEYTDEAQLFVPVHQADRITRYLGSDKRSPTLSRLGSAEWRTARGAVKEAVQEVAGELLELYAKRSVVEGYAFSADSTWQQELEASFPYIETDDQMRVLAEVKRDMESPRPMDRLICGDVGYGKTEVALRAAFKAVMDGKQVAVLVPTTVLAQQHYQTFRQRLAAFPAEVEMLSRFRTPQQQREIVTRLADGSIDIIIGTHRLLSLDVRFKDLGLLIIDEEQRFGVAHKESLKQIRTEIDVLTLTATPIPRTLYMTLTGVRDISTINTPPEERLPIITHVGPYSPKLVRQAILRELERGGQVFFVHNRVQTIGAMRSHLEQLVPEARVTVAHGQMQEHDLSDRMKQFTNAEVDILLSTSIIESGLDIPNANTLIVDRADTFGLAQLYQLRGRVGRGAQRAYSYFFRHTRKQPSLDGRQRLETIAENTQLGAGFSIAMRDLEIRGTGDILGTRQHGHIAAVGFYLYTRLLAEAIRRKHPQGSLPVAAPGVHLPPSAPANIDLPLPSGIPSDYVADKTMRLRLYRRLADIQTLRELDAITEEFKDRFGPPPGMVSNLLYALKIKLLAEKAGLSGVSSESGQLVLRYPEGGMPASFPELGPQVRIGKTALWMPLYPAADARPASDWQETLLEIIQRLASQAPDRAYMAGLFEMR